jgi:Tripartite tricarboxylate transporter family receptor
MVMVVNPSVPTQTVPEFIAYAKDNPGKVAMASAGTTRKTMAKRQSPQRATLLVKGGGTAWLDGNVSSRSRPIYNHAVDRSRESGTFSVLG